MSSEINPSQGQEPSTSAGAAAEPITKMKIMGFEVELPPGFKLYPSQITIIDRMLRQLCNSSMAEPGSALFESATGSGKTIALLAGICAYLVRHKTRMLDACPHHSKAGQATGVEAKDRPPCTCKPLRAYYCCKTTAQVNQVVQDYSSLDYHKSGRLRHTVFASRQKNLCSNKSVAKSNSVAAGCHAKLHTKGGCPDFNKLYRVFGADPPALRAELRDGLREGTAFDIEDIGNILANREGGAVCPYFGATDLLARSADIIFCTQNYIFDPVLRDYKTIDLTNAIVIVDECHQVLQTCYDAGTFTFSFDELRSLVAELEDCVSAATDLVSKLKPNTADGREMIGVLETRIRRNNGVRRCIADLLSWAEQRLEVIWKKQKENFRDAERLVSTLDQECFRATFESKFYETEDDLLTQQPNDAGASPVRMALPHVGYAYHDLCDLTDKLRVDFLSKADNKRTKPKEDTRLTLMRFFYAIYFYSHYKEDYKCTFEMSIRGCFASDEDDAFRQLMHHSTDCFVRLWPLTAAPAFRNVVEIEDIRAIFLASATVSPLEAFEAQVGYRFKQSMLRMPTVVPDEHIFASALIKGPQGGQLNSKHDFTKRNDANFFHEVAAALAEVSEAVPAGILCFFPSHRMLQATKAFIEADRRIDKKLKNYKRLHFEEETGDVMETLKEHCRAIDSGQGSILMAVLRGRISEGINLAGDHARCVVIVGIPFANAKDEYLQHRKAGNDSYTWSTFTVVNQALGRSLRNKNDWSAFILLDERYANRYFNKNLSYWITDRLEVIDDIAVLTTRLKDFCVKFVPLPCPILTAPRPMKALTSTQFVKVFNQPLPKPPRKTSSKNATAAQPSNAIELSTVRVGNLRETSSVDDLFKLFSRVGQVLYVKMNQQMHELGKGQKKFKRVDYGAHIKFDSVESAQKAVELLHNAKKDPVEGKPLAITQLIPGMNIHRPLSVAIETGNVIFNPSNAVNNTSDTIAQRASQGSFDEDFELQDALVGDSATRKASPKDGAQKNPSRKVSTEQAMVAAAPASASQEDCAQPNPSQKVSEEQATVAAAPASALHDSFDEDFELENALADGCASQCASLRDCAQPNPSQKVSEEQATVAAAPASAFHDSFDEDFELENALADGCASQCASLKDCAQPNPSQKVSAQPTAVEDAPASAFHDSFDEDFELENALADGCASQCASLKDCAQPNPSQKVSAQPTVVEDAPASAFHDSFDEDFELQDAFPEVSTPQIASGADSAQQSTVEAAPTSASQDSFYEELEMSDVLLEGFTPQKATQADSDEQPTVALAHSKSTIRIVNLGETTTADELLKLCARIGRVTHVKMIRRVQEMVHGHKKCKLEDFGAYVKFESATAAQEAVKMLHNSRNALNGDGSLATRERSSETNAHQHTHQPLNVVIETTTVEFNPANAVSTGADGSTLLFAPLDVSAAQPAHSDGSLAHHAHGDGFIIEDDPRDNSVLQDAKVTSSTDTAKWGAK